jgi:putative transposase
MLDVTEALSLRRQASLLNVSRSKFYHCPVVNDDTLLANAIREIYSESDCRYGYRKVHAALRQGGYIINHKRVAKLMSELGFAGLYPKKKCKTSIVNNTHKIYPYLLDKVEIVRKDQVWATDITYIRIADRFMYFTAIIDLYSRYIITHELSHTLENDTTIYALTQALQRGVPEIFNSDQGSQFTSNDFVQILASRGIKISMDHKGRCFDNIRVERLWRTLKQEAIYYYRPETIKDLELVLKQFVNWYNNKRIHQSLDYRVPADLYMEQGKKKVHQKRFIFPGPTSHSAKWLQER